VNIKDFPKPLRMGLLVGLANDAAVSVPSTDAILDCQNLIGSLRTHWQAPSAVNVASLAEFCRRLGNVVTSHDDGFRGMMRIATEDIFAKNCEPVNHLRPPHQK
jgi:hypothetical protein